MSTHTISVGVHLATEDCSNCGVIFAMPADLMARLRDTHRTFYCPNGHSLVYKAETEAERYKRLLYHAEDRAGRNYDAAEQAKRSLAATRGQVTKLRKRAHAGTCPFGCRRHFANLERHVATKHPEQTLEGETS